MSENSGPPQDTFGPSEEEQTQKKVFVSTFSMLAKLASIDGKVSKNEVQIIDRFMKEVLDLTPERRKFAIYIFNSARREEHEFEHYAKNYATLMAKKPKMREWMLDVLLRVSLVDKEFSGAERHLLEKACKIFEISEQRFKEMQTKYIKGENPPKDEPEVNPLGPSSVSSKSSKKDDPYAVLRVSSEVSDDELLAAYRRLSVEYGPSRIIELGLPDEFVRKRTRLLKKSVELNRS